MRCGYDGERDGELLRKFANNANLDAEALEQRMSATPTVHRAFLTRGPPKVHPFPHTSLFLEKVGKIRGFVDTALLAHKPLP